VFFEKKRPQAFPYIRKRGGHTLSKGRLLGVQMMAYLESGLWLELAARANESARRLFDGLVKAPDVRVPWPAQANEVFVVASTERVREWRAAGAIFHDWPTRGVPGDCAPRPGETMIRLVTSFNTSEAEIESLLALSRSG